MCTIEVAGVACRLSDRIKAETLYHEMEAVYSIISEDDIFDFAIRLALEYGNPGFDNYILATAIMGQTRLFTDDKKMYEISGKIGLRSFLISDLSEDQINNLFAA